MMSWENELAELISISRKRSRRDLNAEQFWRAIVEIDETVDAGGRLSKTAELELRQLNIDLLSHEIRRRVQELGGAVILDFRPKDWMIRLQLDMGAFKRFKKKAAADPVLKYFDFTHRKPKRKGEA